DVHFDDAVEREAVETGKRREFAVVLKDRKVCGVEKHSAIGLLREHCEVVENVHISQIDHGGRGFWEACKACLLLNAPDIVGGFERGFAAENRRHQHTVTALAQTEMPASRISAKPRRVYFASRLGSAVEPVFVQIFALFEIDVEKVVSA